MDGSAPAALSVGAVSALADALRGFDPFADDAERIDRIRALEELKSAAAAAQARETAAFVASQRKQQRAAGMPTDRVGRGIAAQVGLALRVSPFHARRYVGWAGILTSELPKTFAELRAGRTTEWRAMIVARETAWLSREHRAAVDRELAPQLAKLGDRKVESEAKRLAYRLDPHGYVDRLRAVRDDRRVTLRPAPDMMCRLSGLLPVDQGVAAHAALVRDADALRAAGDPRSRGQVMADLMVERLTGQARASDVPMEVNLVMTDQALLASGDEPATLIGFGPLPAPLAREFVLRAGDEAPRWLRRLVRRPETGELISMESRRRCFTPAQRRFVTARDQTCRTPYCDAPVRHVDHVTPAVDGGKTAVRNAQGLCEACNYARQAPRWHARAGPAGEVVLTTPTGHRYRSRAPAPPGGHRPAELVSPVERRLARLIREAAA